MSNLSDVQIEAISKLRLEPGDILILKTTQPVNAQQLIGLRSAISAHFGFPIQIMNVGVKESIEVLEGRCPHGHKMNGVVTCPICVKP